MTDQPADPPVRPSTEPPVGEPAGPLDHSVEQPVEPPVEPPFDPKADPTPARRPRPTTGPVTYKGDVLESERGPGLGCFRIQLVVLVVFIVLTPLSVAWNWPPAISTVLLFAVIGLLLVTGQTIIFLLRLVAADRRGRRRPLGSQTQTVGELEDAAADPATGVAPPPTDGTPPTPAAPATEATDPTDTAPDAADDTSPPDGAMRQ